jgi:ABC-type hemin transport system substrate-binding protein
VDTSLFIPAGVGVFYTLLVLVSLKLTAQRSKAVHIGSEIAEINFALREGHTIVGVMDTKNAMRFYIGNDVMDEQKYE